jgi:hypothetical protein
MRYYQSRHYELAIHQDAQDDLEQIFSVDEVAAADITVFFEEISGNQDLLSRLTSRGYCHYKDPSFDVDEWQKTRVARYNLWRLKLVWLSNVRDYRIIYAFHTIEYCYYVLAILKRNFNYDTKNPRVKRILQTYEALNIPRH